jgi:hypothetical protein
MAACRNSGKSDSCAHGMWVIGREGAKIQSSKKHKALMILLTPSKMIIDAQNLGA